MQTRIYVVVEKDGTKRMIEATSQAQAIRHCVKDRFTASVATAKDVADLSRAGIQVERAGEEQPATESNGDQA